MIKGRRPASKAIPYLAIALFSVGLFMILKPEKYNSTTYAVAFNLMGPREWGIAMVASSVSSIFISVWTIGFLLGVDMLWSSLLLAAVFTGDAVTPTGFMWSLCFGLATLQSVRSRGIYDHKRV